MIGDAKKADCGRKGTYKYCVHAGCYERGLYAKDVGWFCLVHMADEVERLQDEIEVLKVQLELALGPQST